MGARLVEEGIVPALDGSLPVALADPEAAAELRLQLHLLQHLEGRLRQRDKHTFEECRIHQQATHEIVESLANNRE